MDLQRRRWHACLSLLRAACNQERADEEQQAARGDPNPTASPWVRPTVDVTQASFTEAPAGMADILACDSHDEWRAMAADLPGLLPNLELRPIEHPLPPEVRLAIFVDGEDEERRAVLSPHEASPVPYPDVAAGLAADEITGELRIDGWMVWSEARNNEPPGKVWGAFAGMWSYGLFASDDELFNMLLNAAATAASSNCRS